MTRYLAHGIAVFVTLLVSATAEAQWTGGPTGPIYYNGGNVGVGTSSPAYPLTVTGDIASTGRIRLTSSSSWAPGVGSIQNTTQYGLSFFASSGQYYDFAIWGIDNNAILLVPHGMQQVRYTGDMGIEAAKKFYLDGISGTYLSEVADGQIQFVNNSVETLRILPSGNVGIGTPAPTKKLHVVGDAHVDGQLTGTRITAHYQDIAEWVPSREDLAPGTVVILDPSIGNGVMRSSKPYDTTVAGIVSAEPGIVLGVGDSSKEQVATTGRVRARVDATNAPIAVGDLLVTSATPGMAMKSQPIDIGGAVLHRPGTIVGKALEPLATGQGEILVLLSLQ